MALIWKTWAPLKVKIFLWLAFRRRHWTGDRRRRHGLETREHCYLCDQAPETIDHVHSGHMPIYQGSMEPNLPSLRSSAPARFSNNHRLVAPTALLIGPAPSAPAWTRCSRWFPGRFGSKGTRDASGMLRCNRLSSPRSSADRWMRAGAAGMASLRAQQQG